MRKMIRLAKRTFAIIILSCIMMTALVTSALYAIFS